MLVVGTNLEETQLKNDVNKSKEDITIKTSQLWMEYIPKDCVKSDIAAGTPLKILSSVS